AHYALNYQAKLSAGDRVLIHAAAGGVGLAAVQLSQRAGAQIFATAGNEEKRELLRSLGIRQVMNSRSLHFVDEVMTTTKGLGVDVALNSVSGQFIPASLSVMGSRGKFLEIGKSGIWDHHQVAKLRSDVSYFVIDLLELCQQAPASIHPMLLELMAEFE